MVLMVYRITPNFPSSERFGITSQLQRSSSSVAANIAEGFAQESKKSFLNYLSHSRGSLEETKYHLLLARDLGYLQIDQYNTIVETCDEVGRLLHGMMESVRRQVTDV